MRYKGYHIKPKAGKRLVPGSGCTVDGYPDTLAAKRAIDSLLARHGLTTGIQARTTPTIYSVQIPASKRR